MLVKRKAACRTMIQAQLPQQGAIIGRMSFDAEIVGYPDNDAPPLWESLGHSTVAEAYATAEAHVRVSGSGDRFILDVKNAHHWFILDQAGNRVATLSVTGDE